MFDNDTHQGFYDTLLKLLIHAETIVDWSFFVQHGLAGEFFKSINNDAFSRPQWVNLFQINEPVYKELVYELFASFEFKDYTSRGDPKFMGEDSLDDHTRWSMQNALTIKVEDDWKGFWPNIGDGEFIVRGMSVKKIRDPRVRIARDVNVLRGGMFVTRIPRSFGLLSSAMVDALSVEPRAHTFIKKSLVTIEIVMELDGGTCCWPTTRGIGEGDEVKEEGEGFAGAYKDMSQGDWDNLDPHPQIDPFPGHQADYPSLGYTGHMPTGYDYHYGTAPDGSN
ncbi:hypothetical protein Tco_0059350 [Tanacetum coccineum]